MKIKRKHIYKSVSKHVKGENCPKPAKYKTVRKAFTSLTFSPVESPSVDDPPARRE